MGTSSMYGGPNRSPLLPPDFIDGDVNSDSPTPEKSQGDESELEKPIQNPSENSLSNEHLPNSMKFSSWTQAKKSMSRYISGNAGRNGKKKAVSDYVKGHGGSQNAARSAKSAIKTTINIGDFFSGVSDKGISKVLKDYQIPIEGRKPREILNDVINILAPTPDLIDDSIARKALVITMSLIYEKFDDENKDISLIDSINSDIAAMLIKEYIETYIYERLLNTIGSRIEKKAENSAAAAKIEKELKDYIQTKVSTTLKDKPLSIINSKTKSVNILVEGLYQQCYKVLEDQL